MRGFLRKSLGVFFVVLGVIGWILPILQGWLFIFIGVSLLSPPLASRMRRALGKKFPRLLTGGSARLPLEDWRESSVHAGLVTRAFPVHLSSTDDLEREEARQALRGLFAAVRAGERPERFAYLKQVHGNRCVRVTKADFTSGDFRRVAEADALVTTDPGTALLALSADCLTIFYAALSKGRCLGLAVAHAGWRGTHQRIASVTLESLLHETRAHAADVHVLLGPSIDAEHYIVGQEFQEYFPDPSGQYLKTPLRRISGQWHFDLAAENRAQMVAAGLPAKNIVDSGFSTIRENSFFSSFRLEKEKSGRTVSYIYRTGR